MGFSWSISQLLLLAFQAFSYAFAIDTSSNLTAAATEHPKAYQLSRDEVTALQQLKGDSRSMGSLNRSIFAASNQSLQEVPAYDLPGYQGAIACLALWLELHLTYPALDLRLSFVGARCDDAYLSPDFMAYCKVELRKEDETEYEFQKYQKKRSTCPSGFLCYDDLVRYPNGPNDVRCFRHYGDELVPQAIAFYGNFLKPVDVCSKALTVPKFPITAGGHVHISGHKLRRYLLTEETTKPGGADYKPTKLWIEDINAPKWNSHRVERYGSNVTSELVIIDENNPRTAKTVKFCMTVPKGRGPWIVLHYGWMNLGRVEGRIHEGLEGMKHEDESIEN